MQVLTDDIIQYVHSHFSTRDITKAYAALADVRLDTPRLVRSVLYLSGGSVTLLHHYVARALRDVPQVLAWAEYVSDIGPEPMWVRDMSQPFTHARNLGAEL